jgi:hypothetical protein
MKGNLEFLKLLCSAQIAEAKYDARWENMKSQEETRKLQEENTRLQEENLRLREENTKLQEELELEIHVNSL